MLIGTPAPIRGCTKGQLRPKGKEGAFWGPMASPWSLPLVDLTIVAQNPLQGLGRSSEPCGMRCSLPWLSSGSQKHFFSSGKQ